MNTYFTLFGLDIHYYGVLMASAMLLGIFIVRRLCPKKELDKDSIFDLALIVLPLSIISARLYYVIFSGVPYTFAEFWAIWNGGLAIYGGVIGGFLGVIIFCLIRKKNILTVCDCIAPALILGQAIGRWGNFINQEAFGYAITDPSLQWFPFAVFIDSDSAWHLATFFYESMWNLIVFAILLIIFHKTKSKGNTTAGYLMLYGIGRIFIEGLRTDSLYIGTTGIRVSQVVSGALIVIGLVILAINIINYRRKKNEKT